MASEPLSGGKNVIKFGFSSQSLEPELPADFKPYVDDELVDKVHIKRQVPNRCGTETLDVGMDCVSSICDEYAERGLFPFTGTIESVTSDFGDGHTPTGMERLELATKMN